MNVTLEESIAIYARASRQWFGGKAHEKTQERIDQLAKAGDLEGAEVHRWVREHIARLEQPGLGRHSSQGNGRSDHKHFAAQRSIS